MERFKRQESIQLNRALADGRTYPEYDVARPWARLLQIAAQPEFSDYWKKNVETKCLLVLTQTNNQEDFLDGDCDMAGSCYENLATSQGGEFGGASCTTLSRIHTPGNGRKQRAKAATKVSVSLQKTANPRNQISKGHHKVQNGQ